MLEVSYGDSDARQEIAEDFISRMQAPPEDDFSAFLGRKTGWLKYAVPCLLFVVALGVLVSYLIPNREPVQDPVLNALTKSQPSEFPPPTIVLPQEENQPSKETVTALKSAVHRSKWKRLQSGSARKLVSKGWNRYMVARYHAASVSFGRAVHRAPGSTKGYYGLALSLFEQGFEQAALRVIRTGLRKKGAKAELWLLAGTIHQWLGDEQNARKMYRRYLKVKPNSAFAKDVRRLLAMDSLPAQFAE
jgi:tetratricopeptide (TPR) repeat protein